MKRRTFLEFLGKGAAGAILAPSFLAACNSKNASAQLRPVIPSAEDELILSEGLSYDLLIQWGEPIAEKANFGFNNDYIAFIPGKDSGRGILWVNHEYVDAQFVSGYIGETEKNLAQVEAEMRAVGGSILEVQRTAQGKWQVVKDAPLNRRIDGFTQIPFHWDTPIQGQDYATGTLANCSGGITPWGTILTCEENYDDCFGERDLETGEIIPSVYGWDKHFDFPPEHYGWVVEVNPQTGEARKLVALGRCAHECATVHELSDGRLVVYTGDDKEDECLYKFVGSKPGSLKEGTLYVANLEQGRWIPLVYEQQKVLQQHFANQTEVLVYLRKAAALVGGSPLDRPEDIEVDPLNGNVLVSLTNNLPKNNYFGSILKLVPENGDHAAETFSSDTFLAGGEETGFACPDNMAFDPKGNLWFTSDISGDKMHKDPYTAFKNNGLFFVPRSGPQAGQVIQVASAPIDAELTGPFFHPDGKTLFLSVQHPGEESVLPDKVTSHWPGGGDSLPKPAVVAIAL